jgi:hypothetical protein
MSPVIFYGLFTNASQRAGWRSRAAASPPGGEALLRGTTGCGQQAFDRTLVAGLAVAIVGDQGKAGRDAKPHVGLVLEEERDGVVILQAENFTPSSFLCR